MAAKRRFTRDELAIAIKQHGGNVKDIAAACGCTVKTVYNNVDRYNMRNDLDLARESAALDAEAIMKHDGQLLHTVLKMREILEEFYRQSTGPQRERIKKILKGPVSINRPFQRITIEGEDEQ